MTDYPKSDPLTYSEHAALRWFALAHGYGWKGKLLACFQSGAYPLVSKSQAATLQSIRNRRGTAWLRRYKIPK